MWNMKRLLQPGIAVQVECMSTTGPLKLHKEVILSHGCRPELVQSVREPKVNYHISGHS